MARLETNGQHLMRTHPRVVPTLVAVLLACTAGVVALVVWQNSKRTWRDLEDPAAFAASSDPHVQVMAVGGGRGRGSLPLSDTVQGLVVVRFVCQGPTGTLTLTVRGEVFPLGCNYGSARTTIRLPAAKTPTVDELRAVQVTADPRTMWRIDVELRDSLNR